MTNPTGNADDSSADIEDLPTGALLDQVRSLSAGELQHLIDEESRHENRTPVIEVLKSRLAELQDGDQTT